MLKLNRDTAAFLPLKGNIRKFHSLDNGNRSYAVTKSATEKNIDVEKIRLQKAAQNFEAIFIRKLLSTMRSTMSEGGMYGSGVAGDVYGDIVENALADIMSERSVLGISDVMYRTMVKSIETDKFHEQAIKSKDDL